MVRGGKQVAVLTRVENNSSLLPKASLVQLVDEDSHPAGWLEEMCIFLIKDYHLEGNIQSLSTTLSVDKLSATRISFSASQEYTQIGSPSSDKQIDNLIFLFRTRISSCCVR